MPMPGECFHVCAHGFPLGPVALHLCQRQESFTRPCVFTSCTSATPSCWRRRRTDAAPWWSAPVGMRKVRGGGAHRCVATRRSTAPLSH